MSSAVEELEIGSEQKHKSMREFGQIFIENLPKHISKLQIPARKIWNHFEIDAIYAEISNIGDIQNAMQEVLDHPTTRKAEMHAENAFEVFLSKTDADVGLLRFFNGWNETHKTTSLVSAKIIMRLSADALFVSQDRLHAYLKVAAHMHEVAKDDFGLGHKGHDGMYVYMTTALNAVNWMSEDYHVPECNTFSQFLYDVGVAEHNAPFGSISHSDSIIHAMMASISSELWNGREFNYIAQFIEDKLIELDPGLKNDPAGMRSAKGYVAGHAGEVENRHGLHALAAAQLFAHVAGIPFDVARLKSVMLDYNERVGSAFCALHRAQN